MSRFIKPALFLLLFISVAPDSLGICKWVDENGVVHYAETCPEDSNSTQVPIEPPPSQAQIDATTARAEELRSEMRSRHAQRDQEKEQEVAQLQEQEITSEEMNRRCAEARWNLEILNRQLPVYYDEENQFHTNRSLHHYWYEGPRTYLDDEQRAAEILRYSIIEKQACTESEANIRERISVYMEKRDGEICQHLRNRLVNLKKLNTGIPSDEMRALEGTIANRCR